MNFVTLLHDAGDNLLVLRFQFGQFRIDYRLFNRRAATVNPGASREVTHLPGKKTEQIIVLLPSLLRGENRRGRDHKCGQNVIGWAYVLSADHAETPPKMGV